jgi:hypothetical protein
MSLFDRSVRSSPFLIPFSREAAQAEPVTNEAVEEERTPSLTHLAEVKVGVMKGVGSSRARTRSTNMPGQTPSSTS